MESVLHMTGGEGDTSHAMNPEHQEKVISKAKRIVQETAIDLYHKTLPTCLTIADLGCSSGPNSLLVISQIIDSIVSTSQKVGRTSPEFQVILNDLPGNDFNTLFKSIPDFIQELNKEKEDDFVRCFISGVPGSFFGRLFPLESLNFVHSSNSLHYLSQVPPGIENNKGYIYISKTSPVNVLEAYLTQYQKDFTSFLSSRSKEIVQGGRMVITVVGRRSLDPTSKECCVWWDLLSDTLAGLVSEGQVELDKFNSLNWAVYFPCPEEVEAIIEEEGSFHLDSLDIFEVIAVQKYFLKIIRAATEHVFASHFGEDIIEYLFHKHADNMDNYFANEDEAPKFCNLVMAMTKKA